MDEVMADTFQYCLDLYNAEFQRDLTPACFEGKHLFEVIEPAHRARVRGYFGEHEFFANISVMEGALEVVQELSERHEVFVVSAAMDVPCSFAAKFEWLDRYFPFIPSSHIVFCGDKSIVLADYLIDDNIGQLHAFRGEGILFHAPHNVLENRYRRVKNWEEVRRLFLT
jgi:5'(3')-deoxyribonucleotidase